MFIEKNFFLKTSGNFFRLLAADAKEKSCNLNKFKTVDFIMFSNLLTHLIIFNWGLKVWFIIYNKAIICSLRLSISKKPNEQ